MRVRVRFTSIVAMHIALVLSPVVRDAKAQERPLRVSLVIRLRSDSTRNSVHSADFTVDSTRVRSVTEDSAGRYALQVALPIGSHRLTIRAIGYDNHRAEFTVNREGIIDLGSVSMKTTSYMHADYIPYCVRVSEQPKDLPPLTWLTPAPDSAGKKTWIFCDARRR